MKSFKSVLTFLLSGLFLIAASTTAFAAESWVTDPATGAKIGWVASYFTLSSASWTGPVVGGKAEGKGTLTLDFGVENGKKVQCRGEVEMTAGLLDGRASLKWSNGGTYDGDYKAGLREGKGIYKLSDGTMYDGEWKNDCGEGNATYKWADGKVYVGTYKNCSRNGYGVQKDASGKVLYEGEWKDGKPLAAAVPLKADKVLGIPWGASEEEAMSIMKQRANTIRIPAWDNKENKEQSRFFNGPFAEFDVTTIDVSFYQGEMYRVSVFLMTKEDDIMARFIAAKKGLTERYGAPDVDQGKYLDAEAQWELGGGNNVMIWIAKNVVKEKLAIGLTFMVIIRYQHQATADSIAKAKKLNASKDY